MVINPEISIRYTLPFRLFSQGSRLGARRSTAGILVLLLQVIGCLGLVIIGAICAINAVSGHADLVKPLLPVLLLTVLMIMSAPVTRFVSYRSLRGDRPELRMQFEADENGFRRTIEDVGDVSWRWEATHAIHSNNSVVTIAVRKGAFVFIPRKALSDAEFERLNQMFCEAKKTC